MLLMWFIKLWGHGDMWIFRALCSLGKKKKEEERQILCREGNFRSWILSLERGWEYFQLPPCASCLTGSSCHLTWMAVRKQTNSHRVSGKKTAELPEVEVFNIPCNQKAPTSFWNHHGYSWSFFLPELLLDPPFRSLCVCVCVCARACVECLPHTLHGPPQGGKGW